MTFSLTAFLPHIVISYTFIPITDSLFSMICSKFHVSQEHCSTFAIN